MMKLCIYWIEGPGGEHFCQHFNIERDDIECPR